MEREGFGISVSVNKPIYSSGEPISMALYVFNNTGQEVTFLFSDAQRYDFTIEDEEGREVWRWSEGRMFAQVLGEETLGPGREEIRYTASYQGALEPSSYQITGIVVAKNRPMSASVSIVVK